jgi:F0F1-type ATP synthase membrane subunit c/vacuolar-type H+-ATPase subunit K
MQQKFRSIAHYPILHRILIFGLVAMIIIVAELVMPEDLRQASSSDYDNYYLPAAQNLVTGKGLTINGELINRYPPGYPILITLNILSASFLRLELKLIQLLFSSLFLAGSAIVVLSISKIIYGKPWLALIVSLIFVTYPFYIWIALGPNSETPFIFFMYLGVFLFLKREISQWYCFFAGLAIGLAMLIRPIGIGLGIILALFIILSQNQNLRVRVLLATYLLTGNLVVILPWLIYVYQLTGQLIPISSNASITLLDGLTFAISKTHYRNQVLLPNNIIHLMRSIQMESAALHSTGDVFRLILADFWKNPLAMSFLFLIKAGRSWYATDSGQLESLILLLQVPYLLLSTLAFYCCLKMGGKLAQHAKVVGSLVLYFWVMTILALSIFRYMMPVMGLLFTLWPSIPLYYRQINSNEYVHSNPAHDLNQY